MRPARVAADMHFGRLYATPGGLDDLWAVSDGEALVGLRFVSSAEAARLRGERTATR